MNAAAATDAGADDASANAVAVGVAAYPAEHADAEAAFALALAPEPAAVAKATQATATSAHLGVPPPAPTAPANAGSIGGAVLALVMVVGLILLLGWLAKRMPGMGTAGSNPALRMVGSLSLGPRERVVVVAVGDTQLLVGTGSGGTRVLHTLETPLPLPAQKSPPAFAQVLAQHFGKKPR